LTSIHSGRTRPRHTSTPMIPVSAISG